MLADIVKIHCLTHRANFPMSRTSRIVVCKEGAEEHVLCNDFPNSGLWIYCCNCQTFIAWDPTRTDVSVKECPFCLSSLNPRLYTCDHCSVTMLDFDDQTLRKHHTVLSWGMPQPACPGCHQFPSSTPKIHFCEMLHCNLATARSSCPFCNIKLEGVIGAGVTTTTLRLDAALAEAEARAREAEERRRLAEEAARKEIELRVEAERKAHEIEKKVTRELVHPQASIPYTAPPNGPTTGLTKNAGELIQEKMAAEARARDSEELRIQAEAAVIKETEKRAVAEQKAKVLAEMYINNLSPPPSETVIATKKDKVAIALYAAIATFLFLAFVVLIITMIRLYYS
jgi:hypothetical protein